MPGEIPPSAPPYAGGNRSQCYDIVQAQLFSLFFVGDAVTVNPEIARNGSASEYTKGKSKLRDPLQQKTTPRATATATTKTGQ